MQKMPFDFSIKSVLNDKRIFYVILANINRKSSITIITIIED